MEQKRDVNAFPFSVREDLPNIFVDGFNIGKNSEGLYLISASQRLPNNTFAEQGRILLTERGLRALIDLLSKTSGYYPTYKTSK